MSEHSPALGVNLVGRRRQGFLEPAIADYLSRRSAIKLRIHANEPGPNHMRALLREGAGERSEGRPEADARAQTLFSDLAIDTPAAA